MPKSSKANEEEDSSIDSLFSDEEETSETQDTHLSYDFLLDPSNLQLLQLKTLYKQKKVKYVYSENKYYQEYQHNRHIGDQVKREQKVDNKIVRSYASGIKQLINQDNNQVKTVLPLFYPSHPFPILCILRCCLTSTRSSNFRTGT